jgi:hypothetical protein
VIDSGLASAVGIGASIAACVGLGLALRDGFRTGWRRTVGQRRHTVRLVEGISVGVTEKLVEERLGQPLTRRELPQPPELQEWETAARYESVYRLPAAWLQTLSGADGTILRYAVTVVDNRVRIRVGDQAFPNLAGGPLVLGKNRFSDLREPEEFRLFVSGATASSYYWGRFYLGNPAGYLTYWLSYNDAGVSLLDEARFLQLGWRARRDGSSIPPADPELDAFRRHSRPNTYVCALSGTTTHESVGLGVDRVSVRILPGGRGLKNHPVAEGRWRWFRRFRERWR